jgi:HSP90 family molecular chaperone
MYKKKLLTYGSRGLGKVVKNVKISNKFKMNQSTNISIWTLYKMEIINRAGIRESSGCILAKKTLEMDTHHPVSKKMRNKVKSNQDGKNENIQTELSDYVYRPA